MRIVPFSFFKAGGVIAPTIADSDIILKSGAATTQSFATSGLTWASPQKIFSFVGVTQAPTSLTFAGDTDDTATSKGVNQGGTNECSLAAYQMVINSTLDAAFVLGTTTSERAVWAGLVVSNCDGVGDNQVQTSVSDDDSPVCPSITTTQNNSIALLVFAALGGHTAATIEAATPSGYTFGAAAATGAGANDDNTVTLAWAYKAVAAASTVVSAATWTSALDASQHWRGRQLEILGAA